MRLSVLLVAFVTTGLLAAGSAPAKQPKVFTKGCQVPAGRTVTCTVRLPRTGKHRSARYDLGSTIGAVVVPGLAPPDLRLVVDDLVSSGQKRRCSVRVGNPSAAGTAPAVIGMRATVTALR